MQVNVARPNLIVKYARLVKSRAKRASVYTFATMSGVIIATKGNFSPDVLVLAPLATFSISLAIYLLNDVFDSEVDRINEPTRPFLTNGVTRNEILSLILLLNLLGIGSAFYLGNIALLVATFEILLGIVYSVKPFNFKDKFILKTVTIAAGGALSSLFGGAASGVVNTDLVFCSAMFVIYLFATSPLNDLGDYVGDKAQHRRTIPIVIGADRTIKLSMVTSLIPTLAALIFYETLDFNILAIGILSLIALLSIRLLLPLRSAQMNYTAVRTNQKKMVYLHFLLQGAFLVGSLVL